MNPVSFKDRLGLFIAFAYLISFFSLNVLTPVSGDGTLPLLKELRIYQVISSCLFFIVPVSVFCRFLRPEKNAFLNLNTLPRIYFILTAIACMFFAFPIVDWSAMLNKNLHLPEGLASLEHWIRQEDVRANKINGVFLSDKSVNGLLINLLIVGVVTALSEELFFRGMIQQILLKNRVNPHIAIILTAAIFSSFHLEFLEFLPIFFLGLILGYLYYITQNLWVSIAAHFFNNAFLVTQYFMVQDEPAATGASPGIPISYVLISFAIVIFQLVFLRRYVIRLEKPPSSPNG